MPGRISLPEACEAQELITSFPKECMVAPTFGGHPNPVEVACEFLGHVGFAPGW